MPRNRHAFTIIEVIAAAAILAVLLAALVPATLLVQRHRRDQAVHREALQAADTLLERVLTIPWDDVQPDLTGETIRADEVLAHVPKGTWKLTTADASSGSPAAKRVTLQVSYGTGARTGTVALTAWAYQDGQNDAARDAGKTDEEL